MDIGPRSQSRDGFLGPDSITLWLKTVQEALCSMVFGPKALKYESLEP